MKQFGTVDEYILNAENGKDILVLLRGILQETELVESIKWGAPVYTIKGKNVVGLGAFKSYVGLWFYQGALLNDEHNVLINAQDNITKALRQWRFKSLDDIDVGLILDYVNEAIKNQKQNRSISPRRNSVISIPEELSEAFQLNYSLKKSFNSLTYGKQREYVEYITSAKRIETKKSRLQKIIPHILNGIGLNDK